MRSLLALSAALATSLVASCTWRPEGLDEGPLGQAEAERRLLAWWDARSGSA